ncbi:unnamed protein product [Ectocarpus sp. 12 AP-2014]
MCLQGSYASSTVFITLLICKRQRVQRSFLRLHHGFHVEREGRHHPCHPGKNVPHHGGEGRH